MPTFDNRSESVFVCDMRPGFTEDGVDCELPKGRYLLALDKPTESGRGFRLVLEGQTPDGSRVAGSVPVDMARVGVFDRQAFLAHFDGNFEDLFEWSAFAVDTTLAAAEIALDENPALNALIVSVQNDGTYRIEYLVSGSETVGLALTPESAEATDKKPRCWTRVDVKFIGIGEPYYYSNDWDFPCSAEDVLESLEIDAAIEADIRSDDVRPSAALRQYMPKFNGAKSVKAYLEMSGQERAKGIPLPASFDATRLSADATLEEIADFIFSVACYVRENIADPR